MHISDHIFGERAGGTSLSRGSLIEEFYSDRSRIIFASSFRRLVQKAQVFSLESNTSVRNRLTHSLEVADIGKALSRRICVLLEEHGHSTQETSACVQAIVDNACLLHDIGNPPFGHFGEAAIRQWFKKDARDFFKVGTGELPLDEANQFFDFLHFRWKPAGLPNRHATACRA
jgi:dGTPase